MDKCKIARVAVEQTVYHIDKPYDYLLETAPGVSDLLGCRVIVPFGSGNSTRIGIITEICDECDYPSDRLKHIIAVIDDTPILNDEMRELAVFLKKRTFCTYFDAVKTLLPAGLSFKATAAYCAVDGNFELSEKEKMIYDYLLESEKFIERDKLLKRFHIESYDTVLEKMCNRGILQRNDIAKRKMQTLTVKTATLEDNYKSDVKLTEKQNTVVEYLKENGSVPVKAVCYYTGITTAVLNTLLKKHIIKLTDVPSYRSNSLNKDGTKADIKLTKEQNSAYLKLESEYEGGYSVNLLYGVTGSGKTQVFLKMADKVVSENKGVIVMVPEIALTAQTIAIFNKRYGDKVAVMHSAMSYGKRMDEWRKIKDGKALVAIGTRSAVFAPFENLGLIIIDEEHEHTYKSEQSPRFHARDVAKFRAKHNNCMLILASATPSIESYSNALSGNYNLLKLGKRYGQATLPAVTTVDMKKEMMQGSRTQISPYLEKEIDEVLKCGEQAILLMNRRGFNTFVSCADCGEVITCPNCSISMNYHAANNRLMCHYCGYSVPYATQCRKCGGRHLKYMGAGTQKVESELIAMFPTARILRMDADTAFNKESYNKNLTEFAQHKYDILLGTQMVAKGLDFENVTLVGVLNADRSLYSADYRSFERTFSLLTQVVGRAGRGKKGGRAVIQTMSPENNIIKLAKEQDYDSFYKQEILSRKLMIYPPYCDIAMVVVQSTDKNLARNGINSFFELIKNKVGTEYKDVKLNILGPSIAAVPRVNDKYRFRMIIKYRSFLRFSQMLGDCLTEYNNSYFSKKTTALVDVNPESII